VSSRRVAWPEPGRQNGGEFRITWGRLAAFVSIFFTAVGGVPLYWTISDHWMNRQEIEKKMKDHADHDNGVQAWNSYNFAANRLEYLDDRNAECDAEQMVKQKLSPDRVAICARYQAKYKAKVDETNNLKQKAQEATKEK
jgi:hypothetical protein